MRQGEDRFDGIPLQTLNTLRRIERLLERQEHEERGPGLGDVSTDIPEGGFGFSPNDVPGVTGRNEGSFAEQERDGFFSAIYPNDRDLVRVKLRWYPGIDRLFPSTEQLASARSLWPEAEEWDFTSLTGSQYHYFGIPLDFGSA